MDVMQYFQCRLFVEEGDQAGLRRLHLLCHTLVIQEDGDSMSQLSDRMLGNSEGHEQPCKFCLVDTME